MMPDEIISQIKELALQGKDYDEIKRALENKNYNEKEIRSALSFADEIIVSYQLASQTKGKVLNQLIIGAVVFILGIIITLGSFFIKGSQYILAWGAIISGGVLAIVSYKRYKEPIESFLPKRNKINRKFQQ